MYRSALLNNSRLFAAAAARPALRQPFALAPVMASRRFLGTIPQPPGGIVGTVNDAVPSPPVEKSHGSYHWSFEKVAVLGLAPLVIAPFAGASLSPILDATLGSLIIIHSHLGLESCIVDYIPKRVYGGLHTAAIGALWAGTALAIYGIYEIETNDIGVASSIGKIWNA
ncbi:uncharacterized protein SAPINGB_P001787 [Magnusiomyces paraingens]|uniref:Succinate dehydrogenase [ubiquinone] cytochrome b small subunit n=1 Tax=Magnusiomyces paraingens TaxID=2606893 RepID=A0A5E8BCN3_9ASCO|nr:uncharacterized protein SAPINGB_P001787 [Saprochaete ingens]VVT48454.1 unnamed protein product [Saprochaete ingens]